MQLKPIPKIRLVWFNGGRFYNHRTIYQISIDFPMLKPWWKKDLSQDFFIKLTEELTESSKSIRNKYLKPNRRGGTIGEGREIVFEFSGIYSDIILKKFFGYATMQAFYRHMKNLKLWAQDRGRGSGKWVVDSCLITQPFPKGFFKDSYWWHKIEKSYMWLFSEMIEDVKKWDFSTEKFEPDYSRYDIGKDRLPFGYECNLCGHFDVAAGWSWRKTPGLANSLFISFCPECKAEGHDLFEIFSGEIKRFKPFGRWQDDYYFML